MKFFRHLEHFSLWLHNSYANTKRTLSFSQL
jgi:hypothetical protein